MNGFPTDRRRIVIGAAAVVGLAGLLFGGWVWWQSRSQVSTDDAYVEGSVAIVTGASRGIGRGCARPRGVSGAEALDQDSLHPT